MRVAIIKKYFLFFMTWFSFSAFSASRTVSGYVVDATTGETIIGVNVVVRGTSNGAVTNANGYFVIASIDPGTYVLDFTHIAYTKKSLSVDLTSKSVLLKEVALEPRVLKREAISVIGQKSQLGDLHLESAHRELSARTIRQIPGSQGDVFRAIKYFPGIEPVEPFSPLYTVRGGDPGENLILLDGVPIYNPYHFVGGNSLFNLYAIKDIELMIGGFGVEYGGRNSSVMYITTREGNNQAFHGEISPGITENMAVFDFPIGRQATMMISGRFYNDLISRFLIDMPSYFYDMNTTLSMKIGDRHRFILRGFLSRDAMDFTSKTYFGYLGTTFDTDVFEDYDFGIHTHWKNRAISFIAKSVLHPNLYWQNQIYGSFFRSQNYFLYDWNYEFVDLIETIRLKFYMETDIRTAIGDRGWKSIFTWKPYGIHTLKWGWERCWYTFENDIWINKFSEGKVRYRPGLLAFFGEDKLSFRLFSIRPGLRMFRFGAQEKWYHEFRVNFALALTDQMTLKGAWGQYLQPIVSLNTQEYEISQYLDNYYPLMHVPPSYSIQSLLGLEGKIGSTLSFSLDLYHKDIQRTYMYDYTLSQMEALQFSQKIRPGRGKAYGLEILLKGNWGRLSGWFGYGVSRSTRQFPHIMQGKTHLFDYDRTHSLKTVLNYQVHPDLEYSGTLRILSGIPKTLESAYCFYHYYFPLENRVAYYSVPITPVKNNIRLPMFVKLDLGMKKRVRKGFGARLAKYLHADEASLYLTFGNLLFLVQRNVWFYVRNDGKLYGIGTNYIPEFSAGYAIRF